MKKQDVNLTNVSTLSDNHEEGCLLLIQKEVEGNDGIQKEEVGVFFGISVIVMTKAMIKAMTKTVAAIWYKKADCTCSG